MDPTAENGASGAEVKQPGQTPREKKMAAAIAARNAEVAQPREADTHPGLTTDPNPPADPEVKTEESNTEQKQPDDPKTGAEDLDPPSVSVQDGPKDPEDPAKAAPLPFEMKDGVAVMKLKVNGQVIEMPVDKVVSVAQKNILADNRLREATEKLKSAEALEAQAKERAEKLQKTLTPPPRKDEPSDEEVRAQATELVTALFHSTPEDAVEKLVAFQKRSQTSPGFDESALLEKATETAKTATEQVLSARQQKEAEEKLQKEVDDAFAAIADKYPRIAIDDMLFDLVDARTERLQSEHPDWSPTKLMTTAADDIFALVAPPKPQDPPADSRAARQERKSQLRPLPQAQPGAQHKPAAPVVVDNSPAAVAARMRAQRVALTGRAPR